MLKQLYKYLKKHIFKMLSKDRKELLDFMAMIQRENENLKWR